MSNTVLGFSSLSGQVSFIQTWTQRFSRHFLLNFSFVWNNTDSNDYLNDFVSLQNHTNTWVLEGGMSWQFGQHEVFSGS